MTKTYRSYRHGFAVDVPEKWIPPPGEPISGPFGHSVLFWCGTDDENFNIILGPGLIESIEETEASFRQFAQRENYSQLKTSMIKVAGEKHFCARYQIRDGRWAKKYEITLENRGYSITGSSRSRHRFAEAEINWDTIVRSLRPVEFTRPPATTSDIMDQMNRAAAFFERGNSHLNSGNYLEALEEFERGKMITHLFPGNFLGAGMTFMRMVVTGALSKHRIELAIMYAEMNLNACLLISPGNQDYLGAMAVIQEYKEKYGS